MSAAADRVEAFLDLDPRADVVVSFTYSNGARRYLAVDDVRELVDLARKAENTADEFGPTITIHGDNNTVIVGHGRSFITEDGDQ